MDAGRFERWWRAPVDAPAIESLGAGEWWLDDGRWRVRLDAAASGIAARLDPVQQVRDVRETMAGAGLLAAEDELSPATFTRITGSAPPVRLSLPGLDSSMRAAERALVLKSGLLGFTLLLVAALVAVTLLAERRRRRLVELKADFVSMVSHELRTPLASIRLLGETLARRLEGSPLAKDYPARIVRDAEGLSFTVENILSFNRLEKGRVVARTGEVCVRALVEAVRQEVAGEGAPEVEWSVEVPPALRVRADEAWLRLVLANLVRNAITHGDGELRRVEIRAAVRAGALHVDVSDNGPGIPEDARARLFDPFFRAARPGIRGSGLGLAICRLAMGLHGGEVELLESAPGGTTFRLAFPASVVLGSEP